MILTKDVTISAFKKIFDAMIKANWSNRLLGVQPIVSASEICKVH